jgi:hypothetical protein
VGEYVRNYIYFHASSIRDACLCIFVFLYFHSNVKYTYYSIRHLTDKTTIIIGVSSSWCIVMTTSELNNVGVRLLMCVLHSVPCDQCRWLEEHCIPHFGLKGALACKGCSWRKSRCSHIPVVTSTPTTDIAAWTTAVCNGVERVASTMDCQTQMFGMFINEMHEMRAAVDRVSASATSAVSSLQVAASTVADGEEDEEADSKEVGSEEEQEQEGDVEVDVMMGDVGDESGGGEEENNEREDDNDDDDEEQPRIPRPQLRLWIDKGKNRM